MGCGITHLGARFYVSTTAVNSKLTEAQYAALTYEEVPGLGNHGDTGIDQNINSYSVFGRRFACKKKGEANAGDPDVEFLYRPSTGMTIMETAAEPTARTERAFLIAWDDGSVELNRGIVTGPKNLKGGNEDFKRVSFTLGLQQSPIKLPADVGAIWQMFKGGYAGFFTSVDPKYKKVYTTATGNTLAINPGDPVGRVESIAGGLTLTQPSSPARPQLARQPKGIGVVNRAPLSWFTTGGGLTVGVGAVLPDGQISRRLVAPTQANTELYSSGTTVLDLGTKTWGVRLAIKANANTLNGSCRVSITISGVNRHVTYNPVTRLITGGNATVARTVAPDPRDPTWDILSFEYVGQSETDGQIRIRPELAGSIDVGMMQLSEGGVKPYQRADTVLDITQEGMDDEWYLYSNGTQYMSFAVTSFGQADLFADASQTWTASVKAVTFTTEYDALLSCTTGATAPVMKFLMGIGSSSPGIPYSVIRGGASAAPWSAIPLNNGKPYSQTIRWNGSAAGGWTNKTKIGSSFPSVGTAANETSNINFMHRFSTSPASIYEGFARPFLIDKALSDVEIHRIAA